VRGALLSACVAGGGAAARRWPLVLVLWGIGVGFGVAFAFASAVWLTAALDGALASRTLLHDLDADVLVDLWFHHRDGLRMLAVAAALLGVAHTMVWWWLDGVIVASLAPCSGSPWQAGTGLAAGMARLWCLALLAQALWGAAIAGPLWAFVRATAESPSAWVWYAGGGAAAGVWLLGGLWLVAVHDQARLRLGLADSGALAAWGWAMHFVLRGGRGAFPLALLLQATALGIWALYQSLSLALPLRELLGLTGSLLLGQAFLLARTWLRVWMLAAQRRLQA